MLQRVGAFETRLNNRLSLKSEPAGTCAERHGGGTVAAPTMRTSAGQDPRQCPQQGLQDTIVVTASHTPRAYHACKNRVAISGPNWQQQGLVGGAAGAARGPAALTQPAAAAARGVRPRPCAPLRCVLPCRRQLPPGSCRHLLRWRPLPAAAAPACRTGSAPAGTEG